MNLNARWLRLSAEIEAIESAMKPLKPHSERRAELLFRLKAARTERMRIGEKIKRREKRKAA